MLDWERNWRASGIGAVLFLIVAYIIYGSQPKRFRPICAMPAKAAGPQRRQPRAQHWAPRCFCA
jgi:hypothetical protein